MARRSSLRQREKLARKKAVQDIYQLGILLLVQAEDELEELTALAILLIARKRKQSLRYGRFGRRGQYNEPKCTVFFEHILFNTSERYFKAFLR